jgi:hypothetical protein
LFLLENKEAAVFLSLARLSSIDTSLAIDLLVFGVRPFVTRKFTRETIN